MTRELLAIAPVAHPGGAEIGLLRLLRGLRARGWKITLSTPGPGPLGEGALADGLRWERLALGGLGRRQGLRAAGSWPRAAGMAASHDVVYLNGGVSGRLLPALALRRSLARGCARRPHRLVLHIHDIVARAPRMWQLSDLVLADSRAVAARLPGLDAHVVGCPVDPDPPAADPPWPPDRSPVIAFVGRIEPRKGALDFARAAPLILRELPQARIAIVGDDPYDSAPSYRRQVLATPGIEHFPWVENAAGLMRHIDVLVAPSHQEPFGTVLAEAMAVGTPVVATRVGGLPEVVADGVSGRLIDPGQPELIAGAVLEVLGGRERMGAAAREHARRWHVEDYVSRVESLIAS